jgi:hypothetical protein
MKCNEVRRTLGWAAFLSLFTLATTYAGQNGGPDPNEPPVMTLAEETRKVAYLDEAVRWPAPASVKRYTAQPPAEEKSAFVKAIRKIIDPNMLPERLDERLLHLNAWRAKGRRTYLLDYSKGPYRIRLKNQQVHVQAGEKDYASHWITVIIQRTDKDKCLQNVNLAEVLRFTDRFLSKPLSSAAQDYSHMTNRTEPVFQQQGSGYLVAYPLNAANPPMDGVCIYTDGRTVVINLQERRKVIDGRQRTDPVP